LNPKILSKEDMDQTGLGNKIRKIVQ